MSNKRFVRKYGQVKGTNDKNYYLCIAYDVDGRRYRLDYSTLATLVSVASGGEGGVAT